MPCYHPLKAFKSQSLGVVFREPRDSIGSLTLPCGQCIGCRMERSRSWAVRCMHEAQLFKNNCFITLTYAPEHLPANGSLVKSDFQKFMKRFRKRFSGVEPVTSSDGSTVYPIRYYMAGEYGSEFGRPHYHACIFNYDFPDRVAWRKSPSGELLFRSPSLEELWPYGFSSIGDVTFESAAYVARYIMKKVTGDAAQKHYETVDSDGVVDWRQPEYNDMSRRPGIGLTWFEKYKSDVYPHDYVVVNGSKVRPPRYYDKKFELLYPLEMDAIKYERHLNSLKHLDDNSPERLKVKEAVALAKLNRLKRKLT